MLNSLPSPVALPVPRPPGIPRSKGAPLSNRNALKHGFYAVKNLTPFSNLTTSFSPYDQFPDVCRTIFDQAIPEIKQKLLLVMLSTQNPASFRYSLSWLRLGIKLVSSIHHLRKIGVGLLQPALDLQFVAQHAIALIHLDFHSRGITRDADLFRANRALSDFYSPSSRESNNSSLTKRPFYFLTSLQRAVLEPLLPPSDHAGRRGRPSADPQRMLDAIFWKFAHHARWQDLPSGCPPMLTCRRYYRRLFLSGRLATLYSALYKDLRKRGKVEITALEKEDCFTVIGHKITLRPGMDRTWQLLTSLLFIQQGYQVFRCQFGRKGRNGYEL